MGPAVWVEEGLLIADSAPLSCRPHFFNLPAVLTLYSPVCQVARPLGFYPGLPALDLFPQQRMMRMELKVSACHSAGFHGVGVQEGLAHGWGGYF